jgi:FAD linked oxidases, C-terminal domain
VRSPMLWRWSRRSSRSTVVTSSGLQRRRRRQRRCGRTERMRCIPPWLTQATERRRGRRTYGRRYARDAASRTCAWLPTHSWLDSVPISKLPQLVYESQQDIERSGILYTVLGHAGDGNKLTFTLEWLMMRNQSQGIFIPFCCSRPTRSSKSCAA